MADSEMQDLLLCKPRFLEKGPDIQTKLQLSVNFVEQETVAEQPQQPIYGSDWKMFIKESNLFAIFTNCYKHFNNTSIYGNMVKIITSCLLLIVITITFLMGYQQRKKSQDAIEKDSEQQIVVIRDGKMQDIQTQNLVTGDVCIIREGLIIQCDMRVLDSQDLQVQRNEEISKVVKGSQIFVGSQIQSGMGKGIVIKTGASTTSAQISKRQGSKLLQKQLINNFGYLLLWILLIKKQ